VNQSHISPEPEIVINLGDADNHGSWQSLPVAKKKANTAQGWGCDSGFGATVNWICSVPWLRVGTHALKEEVKGMN